MRCEVHWEGEKCKECKKQNKPVPKQQVEYVTAVKNNLEYDETKKNYTASYIYNQNLQQLPVNSEASLRVMKSFERKIDDLGLTPQVNKAYAKMRKWKMNH